jgi:hypothetical protein
MKSLTDSHNETIVVIEDDIVVDDAPTHLRRAGDSPPVQSFADDPFVVDWAPPQS